MKNVNLLKWLGLLLPLAVGAYIFFEKTSSFDFFDNESSKKDDDKILLQKGRSLLEEGSEQSVRKAMEYFMDLGSRSARYRDEAYFSIGESYEKLGMPKMAMKKYMELIKRSKNFSEDMKARLNFKVARLQIMTLYKDEAYIRLLILLHNTHKPGLRSGIYTELGKLYMARNQIKRSKVSFQIATQEDPTNREAVLLLAKMMLRLGNYYGAFGVYENYLNGAGGYDERNGYVLKRYREDALKVGLDFYRKRNYYKAIEYLKYTANRFRNTPEQEIALFYTASSYAVVKRPKDAISFYKQVLVNSITARDQIALVRIGQLYFDLDRYKQSIHYFVLLQRKYPRSKYKKIALDWEEESRKSLHAYNHYVHQAEGSRPE